MAQGHQKTFTSLVLFAALVISAWGALLSCKKPIPVRASPSHDRANTNRLNNGVDASEAGAGEVEKAKEKAEKEQTPAAAYEAELNAATKDAIDAMNDSMKDVNQTHYEDPDKPGSVAGCQAILYDFVYSVTGISAGHPCVIAAVESFKFNYWLRAVARNERFFGLGTKRNVEVLFKRMYRDLSEDAAQLQARLAKTKAGKQAAKAGEAIKTGHVKFIKARNDFKQMLNNTNDVVVSRAQGVKRAEAALGRLKKQAPKFEEFTPKGRVAIAKKRFEFIPGKSVDGKPVLRSPNRVIKDYKAAGQKLTKYNRQLSAAYNSKEWRKLQELEKTRPSSRDYKNAKKAFDKKLDILQGKQLKAAEDFRTAKSDLDNLGKIIKDQDVTGDLAKEYDELRDLVKAVEASEDVVTTQDTIFRKLGEVEDLKDGFQAKYGKPYTEVLDAAAESSAEAAKAAEEVADQVKKNADSIKEAKKVLASKADDFARMPKMSKSEKQLLENLKAFEKKVPSHVDDLADPQLVKKLGMDFPPPVKAVGSDPSKALIPRGTIQTGQDFISSGKDFSKAAGTAADAADAAGDAVKSGRKIFSRARTVLNNPVMRNGMRVAGGALVVLDVVDRGMEIKQALDDGDMGRVGLKLAFAGLPAACAVVATPAGGIACNLAISGVEYGMDRYQVQRTEQVLLNRSVTELSLLAACKKEEQETGQVSGGCTGVLAQAESIKQQAIKTAERLGNDVLNKDVIEAAAGGDTKTAEAVRSQAKEEEKKDGDWFKPVVEPYSAVRYICNTQSSLEPGTEVYLRESDLKSQLGMYLVKTSRSSEETVGVPGSALCTEYRPDLVSHEGGAYNTENVKATTELDTLSAADKQLGTCTVKTKQKDLESGNAFTNCQQEAEKLGKGFTCKPSGALAFRKCLCTLTTVEVHKNMRRYTCRVIYRGQEFVPN